MSKDKITELLHEGYAKITFEKKSDGQKRVFIGTQKKQIIEEKKATPKGTGKDRKPDPEGIIRLYCPLESGGWRSFDVDTVIDFESISDKEVEIMIYEKEEQKKKLMKKIEKFVDFLENNDKVEIVFTKANGDEREMICTRKDVSEDPKPSKVYDTIRVYDLEADKWKSIKYKRLISYEKY